MVSSDQLHVSPQGLAGICFVRLSPCGNAGSSLPTNIDSANTFVVHYLYMFLCCDQGLFVVHVLLYEYVRNN